MKKLVIDWPGLVAAVRTAGALMAGNAFVGFFILDKQLLPSLILLFSGLIVTLLVSVKFEKPPKDKP